MIERTQAKDDAFSTVTFPCFDHEQVKEINKKIKENIFQKENPSYAVGELKKGEFSHVHCMPLMELLHPWLYQCQLENKKSFGYDIFWDFHLESFNYNVYGVEGEYGWHIDSNIEKTSIDMKLTCLLNLSEEPYEGGKFCAINSDEKIEFISGMGIIFTSLIAHKVTPVTKGKRKTLTYWAWGPSWR